MDPTATSPAPAALPPKQKMSPLRIVLVGVLVILLGVLFFEYKARFQMSAADQRLQDQVLSEEEDAEGTAEIPLLTADIVKQLIGREPSETSTLNGQQVEKYVWPGVLRTYTLHVLYSRGSRPILTRTFVNQDPETAVD